MLAAVMVALAEWIESEESAVADARPHLGEADPHPKNRVRRFFPDSPDRVGETPPQVVERVGVLLVVEVRPRRAPSLARSRQSGGSAFGNALRKVPYFGGFLGAIGDTVSGTVNTAVGIGTFGASGTLGRGISQLGNGIGSTINITVRDAYAGVVGLGFGTVASTAKWAGSAFGNLFKGNLVGFGANLGAIVVDLAIPEYGWWNGWNWGSPQFGTNGPAPINQGDYAGYQHDFDLKDSAWINRYQYPSTGHTPNGIIGGAYGILGSGPFKLLNRNP